MSVAEVCEQPLALPRPAPLEARCRACGGWIATVPAGTPWARGRCFNRVQGRDCRLYGQGQTIQLRHPEPSAIKNDS